MSLEGSGKLGWLEIKWYTSAFGLCPWGVHTIKKNTDNLVVASKEIGLEVNADVTKYMVMSRGDHDAGSKSQYKVS